jgi:MFS superfamily sulfate permease-like transporter
VSGLVVAAATLATLLFLTSLFEQLPEATLGAVVIAALVELVDWRSIRRYYRFWTSRLGAIYGTAARADFLAAMAALLGVLILDTLPGLLLGIVVSIVLLVYRSSRPHVAALGLIPGTTDRYGDVERAADNRPVPGLAILRPESALFFANADRIRDAVKTAAVGDGVRTVILDLETVPFVDVTAAEMLANLAGELHGMDRTLILAHEIGQVREALRLEAGDVIRIYPTVEQAVAAASSTTTADAEVTPK